MEHILNIIADNFVAATIGGCVLVGMLCKSLTAIVTTASRERSRREIAAYIAEGSITPDQGERLIRADVNCQYRNRAA